VAVQVRADDCTYNGHYSDSGRSRVASTMPVGPSSSCGTRAVGLAGVQRRPTVLDASTASPRGVAAHPRTRGQSPARGRGGGKIGPKPGAATLRTRYSPDYSALLDIGALQLPGW
jgi:hypothetical protein